MRSFGEVTTVSSNDLTRDVPILQEYKRIYFLIKLSAIIQQNLFGKHCISEPYIQSAVQCTA